MKLSTIVQGQYQHMSAEYLISFQTFRLKIKDIAEYFKSLFTFLHKKLFFEKSILKVSAFLKII
jgi:hypothetical protein